jgi:hypothetical protein
MDADARMEKGGGKNGQLSTFNFLALRAGVAAAGRYGVSVFEEQKEGEHALPLKTQPAQDSCSRVTSAIDLPLQNPAFCFRDESNAFFGP